jgi:hypothetical protein
MPHSTIPETSSRTQATPGKPPRSPVMPASPVYTRCIPLGLRQCDIRHGHLLWSLTVLVTFCLLLICALSSGDDTQETLQPTSIAPFDADSIGQSMPDGTGTRLRYKGDEAGPGRLAYLI